MENLLNGDTNPEFVIVMENLHRKISIDMLAIKFVGGGGGVVWLSSASSYAQTNV